MNRVSNYETAKTVCATEKKSQQFSKNAIVNIGQVKVSKCPRKNYFKEQKEEDYTFLSGTVRPPYESKRDFELQGVT